jgi:hypothetical protein
MIRNNFISNLVTIVIIIIHIPNCVRCIYIIENITTQLSSFLMFCHPSISNIFSYLIKKNDAKLLLVCIFEYFQA